MRSVLVVQDGNYGGGEITSIDDIYTLNDGMLVLITEKGAVVPDAGFGAISDKYFTAYLKTSQGILKSSLIERGTFSFLKEDYVAPVEKVMTLNVANSGTPDVGMTAGVMITKQNVSSGTKPIDKDYSVFMSNGKTVLQALQEIAAKINADPDAPCTASAATTILTLTGTDGISFNASGMYEFDTFVRTVTTPYKRGTGTYDLISTEEQKSLTKFGDSKFKSNPEYYYSQYGQAIAGKTYTSYNIGWRFLKEDALAKNGEAYPQELLIATSEAALVATLDVIFATV